MKIYQILTSLILLAMTFFAFHVNAQRVAMNPDLEEAKKAIAISNAIYFQAFVKKEPSLFIERYAEDACIMAPGGPVLCGKEAVAGFFNIAYEEIKLRNGKFITIGVYGDGKEFVTEEGLWQSFDAKGIMFDNGKFLVLWKKTAKGWKMFRDSFSSDNK
jgi:ketosteroid isomerase-like protein